LECLDLSALFLDDLFELGLHGLQARFQGLDAVGFRAGRG
jgi:hypothetical protein